ncbi:MAG: restriction endonuclease [Brevinematales bacterium]|nr:restriction endonuclease [Brevinematales bacterium]
MKNKIPPYEQLFNPVIKAIKILGGSGNIEEINQKVFELENYHNEILEIPHNEGKGNTTEFEYRLAWSRTYLKKYGILENSSRGVWALNPDFSNISEIDPSEVVKKVREKIQLEKMGEKQETENEIDELEDWKQKLLTIIQSISASAFERLVQRILRESGFTQVEVTGRSGDGGIDGKGILKVGGLISFQVLFQCKKYQGTVTPNLIRDFRGAMQGRADKGLFITTGNFTRDAIKEATRDGAPPIDLIDGDSLVDKLKELGLGLKVEIVEKIDIDEDWYLKI